MCVKPQPGLLCILLLFSLCTARAAITDGLIGYWPFDEVRGLSAADASAVSGPGVLSGFIGDDSQWQLGRIGNSLRFAGGGQHGRVADYPKPKRMVTVCAWVYAQSRPVWASVVKNWGSSETGQFHFGLTSSEGDLSCYITTATGSVVSVRERWLFPTGSWEHVAFTADGSALVLFHNAQEVGRVVYSGDLVAPPMASLGLGVKLDNTGLQPDSGAPGFWQGKIDELGLWSRALSTEEIRSIFEAGLQGKPLVNAEIIPAPPGPLFVNAGLSPAQAVTNSSLSVTCVLAAATAAVTNVTVHWRTGFGALNTLRMAEEEAWHSATLTNAGSPDGQWTAGEMVRFYITAEDDAGGFSRWPAFTNRLDCAEYAGTVVSPEAVTRTALPVLHWFVENPAAAETAAGTRCCLFYAGNFYDNVFVRIRGGTSRSWPKESFKFEMNRGEKFLVSTGLPKVTEFDLNSTYTDKSYVRATLAADFDRDAGLPSPAHHHLHVRQNKAFHSLALYVEQPNEQFLKRWGFDADGALYKALGDPLGTYEKKTRLNEGDPDLKALLAGLAPGPGLRIFLHDHVNLPSVVNYMATVVITQNIDASDKNHFLYRDTMGSGEWHIFPWDLDLTFGPDYLNTDTIVYGLCDVAAPHCPSHPFIGARPYLLHAGKYHLLLEAMVSTHETRQMLLRRVRTLTDEFLGAGYFEQRLHAYQVELWDDVLLDKHRWQGNANFPGRSFTFEQALARIKQEYLTPRLQFLRGTSIPGIGTDMPGPSPADAIGLVIDQVESNPGSQSQDDEFIRIWNTNSISVDVSGWVLSGAVRFTFPPGTVVPANSAVYVSPNSAAFRARTNGPSGGQGLFVVGNYTGQLSGRGELTMLSDRVGRLISATNLPSAPSLAQQSLRVTEILYRSTAACSGTNDSGLSEFVELRNVSTNVPLDLAGVKFTRGIQFDFTGAAISRLAPGQTVLVVRDQGAFAACYGPNKPVAGQYAGALDNAGERIRLEDRTGEVILEFRYSPLWFPHTDGEGFSLCVADDRQPWSAWDERQGWRPSAAPGGSPGEVNPPLSLVNAVQNTGGALSLRLSIPPGMTGQVDYADQLIELHWQVLAGPLTGTNGVLVIEASLPPAGSRFYRVTAW